MDEEKRTIGDVLAIISAKAVNVIAKVYPSIRKRQQRKLETKVTSLEQKKKELEQNISLKKKNEELKKKIKELKGDINKLKTIDKEQDKQIIVDKYNEKLKDSVKEKETVIEDIENIKKEQNKYKTENEKLKEQLKKKSERVKDLNKKLKEIRTGEYTKEDLVSDKDKKNIESKDIEEDKYDPTNKDNPNYIEVKEQQVINKNGKEQVKTKAIEDIQFADDKAPNEWNTIPKEFKGNKQDKLDVQVGNTDYKELKQMGDISHKRFDSQEGKLIMDSLSKGNIQFSAFIKENGKINIAIKKSDLEKVNAIVKAIKSKVKNKVIVR